MEELKQSDTFVRSCIVMASIVIIIAGLRAAQAIVAPFMIAVFVAITISPAVLWLTRHRIPTVVSILIVVLAIFVIGAGTGIVVGTSINAFSQNLPFYEERIRNEAATLIHMADRLGISLPEKGILGLIDPGAALSLAANVLKGFGNLLGKAFVILLIVIFMLLEVSEIPTRLRGALGRPNAEFGWFGKFTENLRRYLAIKTWVSLATGLSVAIWLWILGVDFPFLWGLLAFLMNYIPSFGSIIAAVPAVALSIIQLGWGSALLVVIGYAACNVVFGTIVEPRFLGRGLGMSTLIVFLSLLFWGWVLGPVGLFLSVPLTMTLIIALNSKPDTQWIAVILGSGRRK